MKLFPTMMGLFVSAALLLAGCGGGASSRADATATAQIAARLPTLEAQLTLFSLEQTQQPAGGPATPAAAESVATEAAPVGDDPDPAAFLTNVALTNAPILGGAGGGSGAAISGGTPGFSGGDGHDTTAVNVLKAGEPVQGTIGEVFDAQNWLYNGIAGQVITLNVIGPTIDPRASLIGPDGLLLAENDDIIQGVDVNAQLTFTLPATGVYTIRVSAWKTGSYTLTLTLP